MQSHFNFTSNILIDNNNLSKEKMLLDSVIIGNSWTLLEQSPKSQNSKMKSNQSSASPKESGERIYFCT